MHLKFECSDGSGVQKLLTIESVTGEAVIDLFSTTSESKAQYVVKQHTKKTISLDVKAGEMQDGISCVVASNHLGDASTHNNYLQLTAGAAFIALKIARRRRTEPKKK